MIKYILPFLKACLKIFVFSGFVACSSISNSNGTTLYVNDRKDYDLVATYGSCYLDDFRYFTMLHQEKWNMMQWETCGNAVMDHRIWRNWPYEQHLSLQINGKEVPYEMVSVSKIEQQFDFRQTSFNIFSVKFERLDMMMSGRSWLTAFQVKNTGKKNTTVKLSVKWNEKNKACLNVREWSDEGKKGFSYAVKNEPATLVALEANSKWYSVDTTSVVNTWEFELAAGESKEMNIDVYIGWGNLTEYKDNGPGNLASIEQATLDRRFDRKGFRKLLVQNGITSFDKTWNNLQQIKNQRRAYLYDRMPKLIGFDPKWNSLWCYTFDLIRSGIYPAQGNFRDIWEVGSLDVYRDAFNWDNASTMHTFCNWDADIAARTIHTFLTSMSESGQLNVSANPYRVYDNPVPQLANNGMALWDCYLISRDKKILEVAYPFLVKHVRWLEQSWNKTPDGPLMDIGYNIDYGPKELYTSTTIWPDVQFFLVDRYKHMAKMAREIGRPQNESEEWTKRAKLLTKNIRKYMWDENEKTFWCLNDTLGYKKIPSPIEFHSMTTDVATYQQAKSQVLHLTDTTKYGPCHRYPYGLTSAPYDSPYFKIKDGWCGTIWPIQTYYTVRGLAKYGFNKQASNLATNLYNMMAECFEKTKSMWEQYDPRNGLNLDDTYEKASTPEIGRAYFTSGIATSALDMLLRGLWGFERCDEEGSFYLTPSGLSDCWQGINKLKVSNKLIIDLQAQRSYGKNEVKLNFSNEINENSILSVTEINVETGEERLLNNIKIGSDKEVIIKLDEKDGVRYHWMLNNIVKQ